MTPPGLPLGFLEGHELAFWGTLVAATQLLGIATGLHGVLHARTSQAAVAWFVALVAFPWLALPLYWVFGRSKFHGYVRARRAVDENVQAELSRLDHRWHEHPPTFSDDGLRMRTLDRLASSPWTGDNDAELLVDGEETFAAVFATIEAAERYLLVQYYILRDDRIGGELRERLVAAARRGVRVYLLYDAFGCRPAPRRLLAELEAAGGRIAAFRPQRGGVQNRFRLNFRNHRKVVLADGRVACLGGLNVGDEYLGRDPRFGPWRDTHLRVHGPCVQAVQMAFVEDWNWASGGDVPDLPWEPRAVPGRDRAVLVLPTGPADDLESGSLFFVQALEQARARCWIATPYFVPDPETKAAMQLAALRGVDVRFLVPDRPDHWLVWHAAWNAYGDAQTAGVRFFRYQPGFLHQKVVLVDDGFAAVGTANFDNRSFRLNFELMLAVADSDFAARTEAMLEADFARAVEMPRCRLGEHSLWFRLKVRYANLFAQAL